MATARPTAVATSASEIPAITVDAPAAAAGCAARSAKALMIPSTVPRRPMNGALFPSVPSTNSHLSYSRRRRSMVEATAFSTACCPLPAPPGHARGDPHHLGFHGIALGELRRLLQRSVLA